MSRQGTHGVAGFESSSTQPALQLNSEQAPADMDGTYVPAEQGEHGAVLSLLTLLVPALQAYEEHGPAEPAGA